MGVPRFYRWLSERYPLINEVIEPEQIPEFDCLYLDMNGIIHNCSHGNTPDIAKPEDEVWMDVFKYISDLFSRIKPKRLVYMAVDGVAPRAKMNQQRSRRFRTAVDAVEANERAVRNGDPPKPIDAIFDSNSITPGTAFMERLTQQLRFFTEMMVNDNESWQGIDVVVSGPDVPGEGEHKIMDYIRSMKSQPDYDPNTRHCVYGLDADLIMLTLATHEPYVALLREEVIFGPEKSDSRSLVRPDRLQLLHIYVLREYLSLEFGKKDLERVIDDFVLFCMLVGNDFLPHLPYTAVGDGGLERLFKAYKRYRKDEGSSEDPWLVEHGGSINWDNLRKYLEVYSRSEEGFLAEEVSKGHWQIGKRRRCGGSGRNDSKLSYEFQVKTGFGYPKSPEEAKMQYYELKAECDTKEDRDKLVKDYMEGLQWSYYYYYRGPPSWHWYYHHHYAPFVSTMVNDFDDFHKAGSEIHFDGGGPVTPFQQLMSVLPASSGIKLLPKVFAPLFTSPSSPVKQYYPQRFDVDIDGVKVPWGGTTLINFVDEDILFKAMDDAVAEADSTGNNALTVEEKERNREGSAHVYRFDPSVEPIMVKSTVARFLPDLPHVTVGVKTFHHPSLPAGMEYFPHWVLPNCDTEKYIDCWPSLQTKKVVPRYAVGVKIFNFASQRESMFLGVEQSFDKLVSLCGSMLKAYVVQVDYPCVHKARVVAVRQMMEDGKVMRFTRSGRRSAPAAMYRTDINNELDYYERHGILFNFISKGDTLNEDVMESLQPILEVQRVRSHHVDETGRRVYDFSTVTERRLASLCRVLEREPVQVGVGRAKGELAVGDRVLVNDNGGKHAGCVGRITRILPGEVEMDTEQPLGWSAAAVKSSVEKVLRDSSDLKWYSPEVAASKAGVTLELWWRVIGSITAKLGRERVQVGMELFHWTRFEVSPGQSEWKMLVIPNYTRYSFTRETKYEYWSFSSYAVLAVKEYLAAFPSVFDGLCELDNTDTNLSVSAKRLLQGDDYEYELGRLNKWLDNQEFRRLPLVSPKYTALSSMRVQFLEGFTDYYVKADATPPHITVSPDHLILADNAKLVVKSTKYRPEIGSRVVYINPEGSVPVGARCTITGVYGRWGEQDMKVELLFDKPTFGCDTAYGRCGNMRGMVVSTADIMLLPPPSREDAAVVSPGRQSGVKMYTSPPVESSLKNNGRKNGKGGRKSKKAPTVTYASRHPDSTALSRELRHMLGIDGTKKKSPASKGKTNAGVDASV